MVISLILGLSFVLGDKYGSVCILPHAATQLDYLAPFVEDAVFSPVCISVFFVKKPGAHMCVVLCLSLWFSSIDQCIYVNTMLFFYYYSSVVHLEIRNDDTSSNYFIIWDYFSYHFFFFLCVCVFHMKLRIVFSISVKNYDGIWLGIALNLYIAFGRVVIFKALMLLIHEHLLHLLMSYSVSSVSFYYASLSFAWLEIPIYMQLFWKVLFPWFIPQSAFHLCQGRILVFMC